MDEDHGKAWNKRFAILDGCVDEDRWQPSSDKIRSLPFRERFLVSFNIWAFLFNVIYYCVKGMWAKASLLFSLNLLLGILVELAGMPNLRNAVEYHRLRHLRGLRQFRLLPQKA